MLSKVVLPVARACTAVLHTGLSVLRGILNGNRAAFHDEWMELSGIIVFLSGLFFPGRQEWAFADAAFTILNDPYKKIKSHLPPDAVIPAAEMVLCKELAGRTETTDLFHILCTGRSAGAEKLFWLVPVEVMPFVVLANRAVFSADCLVLIGIRYNRGFR